MKDHTCEVGIWVNKGRNVEFRCASCLKRFTIIGACIQAEVFYGPAWGDRWRSLKHEYEVLKGILRKLPTAEIVFLHNKPYVPPF